MTNFSQVNSSTDNISMPSLLPFEFKEREALQEKVENAYRKTMKFKDLEILLKDDPKLVPFAYDLARKIEMEGNKTSADEIVKGTINIASVSPASPNEMSSNFLTPPLTGKYPVGIKSYYLEDTSRNERNLMHETDRTRRLLIDVHYPAVQNKEPAYRVQRVDEGEPDPRAHHLWTRSQPGLSPTEGKFPIVFFSHGSGCDYTDYQHIVEELASHGFCVITVNHPFSCMYVPFLGHFQDPRIERNTPEAIEGEIETKAQDIIFIFEQIKTGQIEGFQELLGTSINSDHVGVFGHSQGGAASVEVCRKNASFKAGLDIEGSLEDRPFKTDSLHQPFLTIAGGKGNSIYNENSDYYKHHGETANGGWNRFHERAPRSSIVTIPDADHLDFTLNPLFFLTMGVAEGMGIEKDKIFKINRITNENVVNFFNQHLK